MNAAKLKSEIIQKIDDLEDSEFERVYSSLVQILDNPIYYLSENENDALNAALEISDSEEQYSTEQIINEVEKKYPNLKFK